MIRQVSQTQDTPDKTKKTKYVYRGDCGTLKAGRIGGIPDKFPCNYLHPLFSEQVATS